MRHFFSTLLTRKIFLPVAVALIALAGMGNARAAVCTFTGNESVTFGQINVQPAAAIGDTIAAMTITLSGPCDASVNGYQLMVLTGPWGSVSMPGVWATNVSGVGVRITSTVTTPYTGTNTMVVSGTAIGVSGCTGRTSPCRYGLDQPGTASSYTMTVTMKVELVKIATTVSTTADLSGYVFALSSIDKNNSNNVGNISAHMFSGTKFVLSTCTRTSPNPLIVDLPPLSAAQLSPPGTTGGNTPFSLDFTCATARNISLTMTDALNASTADDKLTISTGSASATGVKLQVLFNGTPIQFSSSSQAAGIPVGSSTGSNDKFTIPLTVRYISTGAVTPGSVNAAATFTLSYP